MNVVARDRALRQRAQGRQHALFESLLPVHSESVRSLEEQVHPGYRFPWRVAEAPAIIPRELFALDREAMARLLAPYLTSAFCATYRDRCPPRYRRPDDLGFPPRFIATDFTRSFDDDRGFSWCVPEIQSFPGNLLLKPWMLRGILGRLPGWSERDLFLDPRFESMEAYVDNLRRIVLGGAKPEETIILELRPMEQKTVVDMLLFVKLLGIRLVDLADIEFDARTREATYRRAVVFEGGVPRTVTFQKAAAARRILSRCLPEEIDAFLDQDDSPIDRDLIEGVFQSTLAAKTASFVVHPQDFFVLSKSSLIGNPAHHPPLRPLTRKLLDELDARQVPIESGIVKTAWSAGGKGLRGFGGAVTRKDLVQLIDATDMRNHEDPAHAGERLLLWQERYVPDGFEREGIRGFQPASPEERDPVYHEIRLMWSVEPRAGGADDATELTLLTGMTRWSRRGMPANAGFQRTPFTGTHGVLVDRD